MMARRVASRALLPGNASLAGPASSFVIRHSSFPPPLNKPALIQKIIEALAAEIEAYSRSARTARDEATNEQSKAENKYDTRGLEASYLARGQSRQAMETAEALQQYQEFQPKEFSAKTPIAVGALVELESSTDRSLYFIGPCAGGTEVQQEGREIFVITPQSPLGQELCGKLQGARLPKSAARPASRIAQVW
jgi:hypothetical protein